jgi:putative DNA primase/helicase
MQQIQETVKNAMRDNGMTPPDVIITDGQLHRFKDESGKLNSYYTAHVDGRAAGMIGNWKTGLKFNWKAEGNYPKLTEAQRTEFKLEQQKQQQLRKAEEKSRHDGAISKASWIWSRTTKPTTHPYLTKKRIKPHNAGLYKKMLAIPVFNGGVLVSIQLIDADGNKRFLSGSKLKGSYSQLGIYDADKPILICEGWATGASLHEVTDNPVYVAFSAGNLKAVAGYVRTLYPMNNIIIMGDNDLSGVGQKAAKDAALAIGCDYLIPSTLGHDWNDTINMDALV